MANGKMMAIVQLMVLSMAQHVVGKLNNAGPVMMVRSTSARKMTKNKWFHARLPIKLAKLYLLALVSKV